MVSLQPCREAQAQGRGSQGLEAMGPRGLGGRSGLGDRSGSGEASSSEECWSQLDTRVLCPSSGSLAQALGPRGLCFVPKPPAENLPLPEEVQQDSGAQLRPGVPGFEHQGLPGGLGRAGHSARVSFHTSA